MDVKENGLLIHKMAAMVIHKRILSPRPQNSLFYPAYLWLPFEQVGYTALSQEVRHEIFKNNFLRMTERHILSEIGGITR